MSHGDAALGEPTPVSVFHDQGRFGRLFGALPPFAADTKLVRDALTELGAKGGPMDAQDFLGDASGADNPTMPAGFTYFGQFIDHDMTFDPTSSLARERDPESIRNFRIPALDLDCLYGGGPVASPHLYDQTVDGGRTSMLIETIPGSEAKALDHKPRRDLPRNAQLTALAGDPRNDENLIVSQFHLAWLSFHNVVVADVKAQLGAGHTAGEIFTEAQRVVRWHYQWLVLHEFLPKTVGRDTADDVLSNGRKHFDWRTNPYIPVEFSVAAYRFGHSQVRATYRANFGLSTVNPAKQFIAPIFRPEDEDPKDPDDLRGGKRAPRRFVDWQTFFDFGDARSRKTRKIDTKLSSILFEIPGQAAGEPTSLATRDLLRGLVMKLPSGQSVASAMALPALEPRDLGDLKDLGLDASTPLSFYVLREAEVTAAGEHLGPVGGRIVAEVIHGLIDGDGQSYLRQNPEWRPTYGQDGVFTVVDLLKTAGVVGALD